MPPLPARDNLTRHGLLVVAIAAALGLLFTGWSSRRGAESVADTVNQGQAEAIMSALRDRHPPPLGDPSPDQAARFLEEHRVEGMLGLGVVERDGTVRTLAGTLLDRPAEKDLGPGPHLRRLGSILRVYSAPPSETRFFRPRPGRGGPPGESPELHNEYPPPPAGMGGPPGESPELHNEYPPPPAGMGGPPPGMDGPPNGMDRPRPRPGAVGRVVVEMEPRAAQSLLRRANRAFGIAAIAAVILVVAATLLWRRANREAALARKLADNERLVSLGTMSAVLAHEIKNPLASLKGNAQLVAESLDEGSRPRDQADRVVEAAVRLQRLVANLLDFARGGPIQRADVDPGELLFLATCEAAPKARLGLDAAPPAFSLDAVRMTQVLENLLRNAEQASPDRVTAEMKLEGDRLTITITDEGPGFSGAPEGFFEPFATTKARGTGLGLAVARRIVELHGGTIHARNRPEGGAEVRLEIPPS